MKYQSTSLVISNAHIDI